MFICPTCDVTAVAPLTADEPSMLECAGCGTQFPLIEVCGNHIAWLFKDPQQAAADWQARYAGFVHSNIAEQQRLQQGCNSAGASAPQKKRLQHMLQAREQYQQQIVKLLIPATACLGISDPANPLAEEGLTVLPKNQSLMGYATNIFRDWSWNNGENEALMKAIQTLLEAKCERLPEKGFGRTLTIGSGAGRFSVDFHNQFSVTESVLMDINPLLMSIACQMINGQPTSLYEFPVAPAGDKSFAVLQQCVPVSADRQLQRQEQQDKKSAFKYVLADAMCPPFAQGTFDTVLSPWVIDIIPDDLADFIPKVNHLLADGGVWINTGSLAFFHEQAQACYSETELVTLIESKGFEVISSARTTVPYLNSPHSAHSRSEKLFSFCAVKTSTCEFGGQANYLPDWVAHTEMPIPEQPKVAVAASNHLLQAQVLGAIDGERSAEQIAALVAQQYELPLLQALQAVRQILTNMAANPNR